jgi:hypothetical protein
MGAYFRCPFCEHLILLRRWNRGDVQDIEQHVAGHKFLIEEDTDDI